MNSPLTETVYQTLLMAQEILVKIKWTTSYKLNLKIKSTNHTVNKTQKDAPTFPRIICPWNELR